MGLIQAPEGTVCSNTRCGRTKNLWQRPDTAEWLCWPHYSRARKLQGQYSGRKRHYEFAVQASRELHPLYQGRYDGGVDYATDEHFAHRSFAIEALQQMSGMPPGDRYLTWLEQNTWANRALKES